MEGQGDGIFWETTIDSPKQLATKDQVSHPLFVPFPCNLFSLVPSLLRRRIRGRDRTTHSETYRLAYYPPSPLAHSPLHLLSRRKSSWTPDRLPPPPPPLPTLLLLPSSATGRHSPSHTLPPHEHILDFLSPRCLLSKPTLRGCPELLPLNSSSDSASLEPDHIARRRGRLPKPRTPRMKLRRPMAMLLLSGDTP